MNSCFSEAIKAINNFLVKSNDDLEKELKEQGYAITKKTVEDINNLEEILDNEIDNLSECIASDMLDNDDLVEYEENGLDSFINEDDFANSVKAIFAEIGGEKVLEYADAYIKQNDNTMEISKLTNRSSDTIDKWINEVSSYFKNDCIKSLKEVLQDGISSGKSIDIMARELQSEGIRDGYFKSRTVAQTEILRLHSMAVNESMVQTPWIEKKEWIHTGAHKNKPRPNHQAMNSTIVLKNERFTLYGIDGCVYHPMYPRDSCLPASETVNCKCIHRPVANDDPVTFDFDEKTKLQSEAIENDNEKWLKEKDMEPVVNTDGMYDFIKSLDKEDQINYWGGGNIGKQRWAMVESGVIRSDEDIQKMFKTNESGIRSRKTLNELQEDGIISVKESILNHSVVGEYIEPSKLYPNGRLKGGGHTQAAMIECDKRGIEYTVNKTFSNGVRIGNVPSSKLKIKQSGNGQAWFPEDWTDVDLLCAGTFVGNSKAELVDGYHKTAVYKNVAVRVLYDSEGSIATVCPDLDQDLYVKGVV